MENQCQLANGIICFFLGFLAYSLLSLLIPNMNVELTVSNAILLCLKK